MAVVAATALQAQFAPHVVLDQLQNPRGLAFDSTGNLYVTESGHVETPGADTPSLDIRGSTYYLGSSGAITQLKNGQRSQLLSGLATLYSVDTGEVTGVQGIDFAPNGDLYYTMGLGANPLDRTGGFSQLGVLMRVPAGSSTPELAADVAAFEGANNPSGGPVDSNPFQIAVHAGGVLVADAGANAILNANFDGTIDLVKTLPALGMGAEAVPTTLALSDAGDVYVSQLTGFPFPPGGASVFKVEEAGLTVVGSGFTNVIDMAMGHDGMLYVLEFAHNGLLSGDPTGGLWRLDPNSGQKTLLMTDGLIAPTALAFDHLGSLYIANQGVIPGAGQVIVLHPVPEPSTMGGIAGLALCGVLAARWVAGSRRNRGALRAKGTVF